MTITNGSILTIEGSLTIQSDSTGTGSIIESNGLNAIVQRYIANPDQFHMLASAVANAVNNDNKDANDLFVKACFADEGPTMKRFRPRAKGRAGQILKRSCHITIVVEDREA